MRLRFSVVLAMLFLAVTACTEDTPRSDLDLPESPEPIVVGLDDEVTYAGMSVVMTDLASFEQSARGFPRLIAVMRSENVSSRPEQNPLASLLCDESSSSGAWGAGSTWEPKSSVRVGAVKQGQLILSFPTKDGTPLYPVLKCTNPTIELVLPDTLGSEQVALIDVPPELIDEAVAARRGPERPLPLDLG